MNADESWRQVPGFSDYSVSTLGRVVSYKRSEARELRVCVQRSGYLQVGLRAPGVKCTRRVHALVAAAFLGPRPDGQEVRHLDGDQRNNALDNLAYGTPSENAHDRVQHGTDSHASKTECVKGHPLSGDNLSFDRGRRRCRTCSRERNRRYRMEAAA